MVNSRVYFGEVMHMRLKPRKHLFRYKVFSLFLDIDNLEILEKESKFFKVNKWGPLSLYARDHGSRKDENLRNWVDKSFKERGFKKPDKVFLLCFPRVFGLGFSPLSVFFCYRKKVLDTVIYEVKNTFGDQTEYFLQCNADEDGKIRHNHIKEMYVSPFIDMNQTYHFTITPPKEKLSIKINERDQEGDLLIATQTGKGEIFNDKTLFRALTRYPFMLTKVLILIHWNALILFLKRIKYYSYSEEKIKNQKI
tara:strand:- start:516 stop:1271 length:756 start_codon:yes stop_codon:yes gene_type:complete